MERDMATSLSWIPYHYTRITLIMCPISGSLHTDVTGGSMERDMATALSLIPYYYTHITFIIRPISGSLHTEASENWFGQ